MVHQRFEGINPSCHFCHQTKVFRFLWGLISQNLISQKIAQHFSTLVQTLSGVNSFYFFLFISCQISVLLPDSNQPDNETFLLVTKLLYDKLYILFFLSFQGLLDWRQLISWLHEICPNIPNCRWQYVFFTIGNNLMSLVWRGSEEFCMKLICS